jgi:hypothetical protein
VHTVTANRYPLAAGRELLVMVAAGRAFLTVQGLDGGCTTGPLAVHLEDVDALCRALVQETGAGLDAERVREVLRGSPGLAGYKRLRAALTGMSMARRRAAVSALQDAGEVVDRGERGRPRLYIAPKPGYSHRNPPQPVGVGTGPGGTV